MVKISVIVPVYNVKKYLEKCVESLLSQSLDEIEVILIDDGSTDGSGSICEKYKNIDKRVYVVHKENAGQGLARNSGLDIAKGKYIMFLDSDDFLDDSACSTLFHILEETGGDMCCYGYVIEDKNGKTVYKPEINFKIYEQNEITSEFILHFFGDSPEDSELRGVSACMSVFKRDIIQKENLRFHSERKVFSEDTIFSLDFCKFTKKVVVVPEYFYHYRQNSESFSHKYRKNRFEMTQNLCDILQKYAYSYGVEQQVRVRIAMVFWVNLMECIKQEIRSKTIKEAYSVIRTYCYNDWTKAKLKEIQVSKLPMKQALFLFMVKNKLIWLVIVMGIIRNKKGL